MDILMISEYILIASLIIFTFAAVRIATHRTIAMGLIGSAAFSLAVSLLLVSIGEIYSIDFSKDVGLAMIILGVIGTVAFAITLRRDLND